MDKTTKSMQSMYVQNRIYMRHNTIVILNSIMVAYFKDLTYWKQRNAYNITIENGNGSRN